MEEGTVVTQFVEVFVNPEHGFADEVFGFAAVVCPGLAKTRKPDVYWLIQGEKGLLFRFSLELIGHGSRRRLAVGSTKFGKSRSRVNKNLFLSEIIHQPGPGLAYQTVSPIHTSSVIGMGEFIHSVILQIFRMPQSVRLYQIQYTLSGICIFLSG
jgi:hypothetical protein